MAKFRAGSFKRSMKTLRPRFARVEPLEPRWLLAAPTLGYLPSSVNIAAGAPLPLVLGGQDADGDGLTYTVTSSNPVLTASILKQEAPNGNRSMRITVKNYGEMVFELFEGLTPNTTARIIEIAESGWYEDRIFHRVIDGFMIQGGSGDGLGITGTGQKFDDEYHADLQFTSPGLLAMAKAGDDTNDSQFFITDIPSGGFSLPRWLDFNHTIFGMITDGDDVREAISNAETDSSDRPLEEIVIESVEIFRDTQNAVMLVGAPHGTYDSGDITVTVSDGKGGTASKTIRVNVLPDSSNSNPFLGPIDPVWLEIDTPHHFQLEATDVEGDTVYYSAELLTETSDLAVSVDENGLVTIVPKNGAIGVAEVVFRVGPTAASLVPSSTGTYDESKIDSQVVMIHIPPATPTIKFAAGMDTGVIDGSTNRDNSQGKPLDFNISGLTATSALKIHLNGVEVPHQEISRIAQGDGSANYVATIRLATGTRLSDGDYILQAQQVLSLGEAYDNQVLPSDVSAPFLFAVDTEAPRITSAPVTDAYLGELYRYNAESPEEGEENILYQLKSPVPSGMVIDPSTGVITWTPIAADVADHPIVVLIRDGAGNEGSQQFTLEVFAPVEVDIQGDTIIDELETVTLLVTAVDPAEPDSPMTISLEGSALPAGADYTIEQLDAHTARFTWHTGEADGYGRYDLVFEASDGARARSHQTVQVTVREVNSAPYFTQVFDEWTGEEASLIDFRFLAADADLPANQLVFSLFGDVPDGAEIDAATGRFTWSPDETQGGRQYRFGVRVTDSGPGNLSAEHTVTITVVEDHKPPVLEPTPAQRVVAGEVLEFQVIARDPDIPAVALEYALEGDVPRGMEIDAASGQVRWQVPEGFLPAGVLEQSLEVTIVASKIAGESATALDARQVVEITVVDSLAELIAAMLTPQSSTVSPPLAGPETAPGADSTITSSQPVVLQQAGVYNDRGFFSSDFFSVQFDRGFFGSDFFGTQFGPTGAAGGGGPQSSEKPEPKGKGEGDSSNPKQETTSLDRLLDQIAAETGESLDGMLAAIVATDDDPGQAAPRDQARQASAPTAERPADSGIPFAPDSAEGKTEPADSDGPATVPAKADVEAVAAVRRSEP